MLLFKIRDKIVFSLILGPSIKIPQIDGCLLQISVARVQVIRLFHYLLVLDHSYTGNPLLLEAKLINSIFIQRQKTNRKCIFVELTSNKNVFCNVMDP